MSSLAAVYQELGDCESSNESLNAHQLALRIREAIYSLEANQRLRSQNSIALVLGRLDRHSESVEILKAVLKVRRRLNGNDHMATAVVINNIGYGSAAHGSLDDD